MYFDLANILIFLVVGLGFIVVNLGIAWVLRPKGPQSPGKLAIYECGEPTIGQAWIRFDIRFYTVALLFVIFDIEIALLFPWAAIFRDLTREGMGWIAFLEVGTFIAILMARMAGADTPSQAAAVTLIVPSHPKYLYVVRSVLYPLALEAGFGKKSSRHIVLAVDEACSNIIKHAYGGDTTKTISLAVTDDAGSFTVRLSDTGRKVDRSAIAPRDLGEVRPGGLGTHFMTTVFDRVDYDTSPAQGTVLTLEKRKQQVNV